MPTTTLATLFDDPPRQWGLRGDPHLWHELAAHFASTPLPASEVMLVALVHETFAQLTGAPMSAIQLSILVPRYPKQGMSGGRVSPAFWRETAVPLLCERYRRARGPQGPMGDP